MVPVPKVFLIDNSGKHVPLRCTTSWKCFCSR